MVLISTRRTRNDAYAGEGTSRAPCGHTKPCGCTSPRVAACCLNCPLPRCRYEAGSRGIRTLLNEMRNAEIARLRVEGVSVDDLVWRFGLGRRSIWRILSIGTSTRPTGGPKLGSRIGPDDTIIRIFDREGK